MLLDPSIAFVLKRFYCIVQPQLTEPLWLSELVLFCIVSTIGSKYPTTRERMMKLYSFILIYYYNFEKLYL